MNNQVSENCVGCGSPKGASVTGYCLDCYETYCRNCLVAPQVGFQMCERCLTEKQLEAVREFKKFKNSASNDDAHEIQRLLFECGLDRDENKVKFERLLDSIKLAQPERAVDF
jgi:NMD protein affecting ribosome stability and mRNA decay